MKLKIAVCDDEEIFIEQISAYISDAAKKHNAECSFVFCNSGNELIKICKTQRIDAIFLDIAMPGFNGFETAEQLLKIRSSIVLVFVSNKESMVFSSYEYKPFWFVPKSKMELLEIASDRVVKKLKTDRLESDIITIKIENRIMEINLEKIMYFKTEDHYIRMIYKDGKVSDSYREKLDNIEVQLNEHAFVRCHNRCLVNCRKISCIENSLCVMLNNEKIPVSRNKLTNTKEAFQAYLRRTR